MAARPAFTSGSAIDPQAQEQALLRFLAQQAPQASRQKS